MIRLIETDEFAVLADACRLADAYGPIVRLDPTTSPASPVSARDRLGAEPCIVVGVDVHASCDEELSAIAATVGRAPLASVAATVLLRGSQRGSVDERIARESAVYSLLQGGPEFTSWRATRRETRPVRDDTIEEPKRCVLVVRSDSEIDITLNRPTRGNAVNVRLRDELTDALQVALLDDQITVALRGAGPDFCTGGDLNEFGTFPDPATSHIVRLQRSPARMLARLRHRLRAYVHGRCIGSGIELAAFSGRIVASPDATFRLPELGLGLVPGAGGTVSMTDRIGAERVLWMLLTDSTVDAATALSWGLVDEIGPG